MQSRYKEYLRYGWQVAELKVHDAAKQLGWWSEKNERGTIDALRNFDLSGETLGAIRVNDSSPKDIAFSLDELELAHQVIRIMDYSVAKNLNVIGAILAIIEHQDKIRKP